MCVAVVVLTSFAGCGGGGGTGPGLLADYFPLAIGNTWTHHVVETKMMYPPDSDTFVWDTVTSVETLNDTTSIPGHTCAVLKKDEASPTTAQADDSVERSYHYYERTADNVLQLLGIKDVGMIEIVTGQQDPDIDLFDNPLVLLKGLVRVGTSWVQPPLFPWRNVSATVEVVSVSETVTVQAGVFTHCVKVVSTTSTEGAGYSSTESLTYWWAKGVGLVKGAWCEEARQGGVVMWRVEGTNELKSHSLN